MSNFIEKSVQEIFDESMANAFIREKVEPIVEKEESFRDSLAARMEEDRLAKIEEERKLVEEQELKEKAQKMYKSDSATTSDEKQKEISSDLKMVLDSSKYNYTESFNQNFISDTTGASKVSYLDFNFNDKSAIRVICWVLSEEFKSKHNNMDRLVVAANSALFMKWINTNMIAE